MGVGGGERQHPRTLISHWRVPAPVRTVQTRAFRRTSAVACARFTRCQSGMPLAAILQGTAAVSGIGRAGDSACRGTMPQSLTTDSG